MFGSKKATEGAPVETKEQKAARKLAEKEQKKREAEEKKAAAKAKKDAARGHVEEKKDDDDASVSSQGSKKNLFGFEKKKPRAEYQAEIDELKLRLAQAESDLQQTHSQLQRFQSWARSCPAF